MNNKNGLSRISIDIPKIQHKKLKRLAAELGVSMRQIVLEALELVEECKYGNHEPNEETIKAIEEVKARKKLIKAENAEDLFEKLGI
ncbi:hypothetical protein H0X48_03720 [Candidatus Dependentiae bacterium]|nr:hypothetical protein [Candidatus Dependentiae bacterium]